MKSKTFEFLKDHQDMLFIWILFLKMILLGVSLAECILAGVILITQQAARIIGYLFPKRPDLYTEMQAMQKALDEQAQKVEGLQSDTTALKFGMARK